jgi:hypothetical protein
MRLPKATLAVADGMTDAWSSAQDAFTPMRTAAVPWPTWNPPVAMQCVTCVDN